MFYADSSFFASLYLVDGHFSEAATRLTRQPEVMVTPFHRAEVTGAIFQQVFRGRLSAQKAQQVWSLFDEDCSNGVWKMVELPEGAFPRTEQIARRHAATLGVRTLDSLHIAAALELKANCFWTFDDRQRKLAQAEGLATD